MKIYKLLPSLLLCMVVLACSCNKLIDIPESKNQIEKNYVFTDSNTALSALLGIYYTLGTPASAVNSSMKFISVYADELIYTAANTALVQFNQGKVATDNANNSTLWNNLYSAIYQCNVVIESIDDLVSSPAFKNQVSAEAKFLRAYCYYYLINLYGQIPLILTTDVKVNRLATQSNGSLVNQQVIKDLSEAYNNLGETYAGPGKVRANKLAAAALLSRVCLNQMQYEAAVMYATEVINEESYSPLPSLETAFSAGSKEAILQFWCANGVTGDATTVIPSTTTTLPQYSISEDLNEQFEPTDGRKAKWISTNTVTTAGVTKAYAYPAKYKNRIANATKPEFLTALRVGEQYLNRAEAYAQLDQLQKATDDLNIIRQRATGILPLTLPSSKDACLEAVFKERRLELFGEWGHRFFDLKRSAKIDGVMSKLKPNWVTGVSSLLPIPNAEIVYNNNLNQNYGY